MTPIEFIDNDNAVVGEKSRAEIEAVAKHYAETHDIKRFGPWTLVTLASFEQEYRGIPYFIRILTSAAITEDGLEIGHRDMGSPHGKWAVVEFDQNKLGKLSDAIRNIDPYWEFLWHFSDYSGQETKTLKEQVNNMQRMAHEDIDELLDGEFESRMMMEVAEKNRNMEDIKEFLKSVKK